jgi:cell division protein FtsW
MPKSLKEALGRIYIPDLLLFSIVLFFAGLGLIMVYSASSVTALERFGDSAFYLKRQAAFVLAGLAGMILVTSSDYNRWVRWGGWMLLASVVSLVLIHVPGLGIRVNGALRWLNLGGFRLQPSEFAKLACILYLTWALVRKGSQVRSFAYGLLPLGLVAGLLAGLLLLQPDLGNAVLLMTLAGLLIFLAGAPITYLGGVVLAALPAIYFLIIGREYRMRRLMAFLNPWDDPSNTSYQIVQSFTAFFSGGLWGRGLGNSQEKLYYLPEAHTDFVASVVGEEIGFVGIAVLVVAFAVFVIRGYRIALRAPDPTGFLVAAGCTTLVGLQALLNLCVVTGLLPTKGLPLPFLSHGGSALLVSFFASGLILSVGRKARLEGAAPDAPWLRHWNGRW